MGHVLFWAVMVGGVAALYWAQWRARHPRRRVPYSHKGGGCGR